MIYRKKDIECILNRIDKVIDKNNFEFANAGFLEGNLGYCLYYYYRYLLLNEDLFLNKLSYYLEKSIHDINNNKIEYYSPAHIIEIGRVLAYFVSEEILDYAYLHEFSQSSEKIVLTYLYRKIEDVNFDSFDGVVLVGNYFLDLYELGDNSKHESIILMLNTLLDNAICNKNQCFWKFNFRNRAPPFIELGIIHGMAGIVCFLSRVTKNHIGNQELIGVIQKACNFIISCQSDKTKFLFPLDSELYFGFPCSINLAYGDIGIGYILKTAGIVLNSDDIKNKGEYVIGRCANYKDDLNGEIKDAELIYGAAGLMSFFDNMAYYEDKDEYRLATIYWLDKIIYFSHNESKYAGFETYMNGFKEDVQYSFTHGLIGIAVALICYILKIPHKYLKLINYESYIYETRNS